MVMRMAWRCSFLFFCLGLAGCFPEAETRVEEQKNPYFITGKSRVTARDYKGAIEAFEKALEINPRSALAHFELGLLYEQQEADYAAAIYHYNQAIKLRPNGAHPADNARVRLPGCRQEMVKTDLLATVNPSALRESERLRGENLQLRKQADSLNETIKELRQQLASRAPAAIPNPTRVQSQGATPAPRPLADKGRGPEANLPPGRGLTPLPPRNAVQAAPLIRTHTVKSGDTLASIARRYNVHLDALLAANPRVEPTRINPGQTITIPAS